MSVPATFYVVSWHIGHVVTAIYPDRDTATQAYDLISPAYAKVLYSMASKSEVARYGGQKWADLCLAEAEETTPTDEWRASVSTLAWHESNMVQLVGFTTPDACKQAYDSVSSKYAKCLVATPEPYPIFSQYGEQKWVDISYDGIKTMFLAETHIVAWHIGIGNVRVVSVPSADQAKSVYHTISSAYAKCLYSSASQSTVATYGGQEWVDICIGVAENVATSGQRRSSSFAVGWHGNGRANWDSYADYTTAKNAYDEISPSYAKAIVGTPTYGVIDKYGGGEWVQICLDNLADFLQSYNDVLSFHTNAGPQTIVYGDSASAAAAYDVISPSYAKVLVSSTRGVLKSYGGSKWVDICKKDAEAVLASGTATSQRSETTYVGSHTGTGVNVVAYPTYIAAKAAYDSIDGKYAKVLMDGPKRIVLTQYGGSQWVNQCVAYINGLFK